MKIESAETIYKFGDSLFQIGELNIDCANALIGVLFDKPVYSFVILASGCCSA